MAKSKIVDGMMKSKEGAGKAFPGSMPPFDGQDPNKPGYSSNPGEKLSGYGNPGPEMGLDEPEGHATAVQLLDNAMSDLQQLSAAVPEVDRLIARLEALRPKVEAADQGEEEAPDLDAMPEVAPGASV